MKIKNIPVARGTVVRFRDSNGRIMTTKGIVLVNQKPSAFSRAYGRQVAVCSYHGDYVGIHYKGAADLVPVGKVKRIPKACLAELKIQKEVNPTLFRGVKRRKRRK